MARTPKAPKTHWGTSDLYYTRCGIELRKIARGIVLLGDYPWLKALTCKTCLRLAQKAQGRRLPPGVQPR